LIWAEEERGTAWARWIGRGLDVSGGLAAVVGQESNPTFPDRVYLVVSQAAEPTTYKAVLVWRDRPTELELPRQRRELR
jgi:hypothetical protein